MGKLLTTVCFALTAMACLGVATVTEHVIDMPTYPFSDPDPVPCTSEKRYPYFRYDGSALHSVTQAWRCVTLENERVRVTLLPQIGGKV